ncbi:MAG: hypothetical protein V4723_02660 [Pseudomonadota bacterium]
MNLHDQVIHRCIHAACARPMPRRVNFCPYCGTGQHDGVVNPMHVPINRPAQTAPPAPPAPVPLQKTVAAPPAAVAPSAPLAAAVPPAPSPPPAAAPPPAQSRIEPTMQAAAAPVAAPPAVPPVAPGAPKTAARQGPPKREPVRLRYWLMALALLWLVWIFAKPSSSKIEERIESAILASKECRFNDAQSELIALRMTKATPEQLKRLQAAINAESPACERKRQRAEAWTETTAAVATALQAGDPAKASARLGLFTRRWKEDDETRKLREQIAAQRQTVAIAVPAAPAPMARQQSPAQSARNLIDEAERAIKEGNYKSASDKLETCITMVDAGNRECAAFKVHADRLQGDMLRCLAQRREWYDDRCH